MRFLYYENFSSHYEFHSSTTSPKSGEAVNKYAKQAPRFCAWLEENAPEGMTFYGRPQTHWKRVRTVNIVERLNCEVKRRTRVVRLFPNVAACERLVTAILVEIHDEWVGSYRYLPTEQSL